MYIFTLLVFILSKEGKHLVLPSLSHSLLSLSLSLPNQAFSWLSHPFEALGQRLKDTFLFNLSSLNFFTNKNNVFQHCTGEPIAEDHLCFFIKRTLYVTLKSWDSITKGISLRSSSTFLRKNIHFAKAQPHSSTPSTTSNQHLTIRSAVQKNKIWLSYFMVWWWQRMDRNRRHQIGIYTFCKNDK